MKVVNDNMDRAPYNPMIDIFRPVRDDAVASEINSSSLTNMVPTKRIAGRLRATDHQILS
jgi:hypothetical protein